MARIPALKTKLETLGLNIDHKGLRLINDERSVLVQSFKDGNRISKSFKVRNFDDLTQTLVAADKYRNFYKAVGSIPRTTNTRLIEDGFDLNDDYRGISFAYQPGRNMALWTVVLRNKKGTQNRRAFSFDVTSTEDSKSAMKKALAYREEIMGDILRLNPKTSLMDREHIVGKSKSKNLIKNIIMIDKPDGIEIGVNTSGEAYRMVGLAKTWKTFKSITKKAVRSRNDELGISAAAVNLDAVAAPLREYYLSARGL